MEGIATFYLQGSENKTPLPNFYWQNPQMNQGSKLPVDIISLKTNYGTSSVFQLQKTEILGLIHCKI